MTSDTPAAPLTFDEATAAVTAPGQRFETTTIEVDGRPVTAFANAPATLRQWWASARQRPDETYLVYEDERWSFGDVMACVDGLAHALVHDLGVAKGDRVAIGMRNYPEWICGIAAITSIGAISVSLNSWWTEDEMDFALRDSGTTVLLADLERVGRAAATMADTGMHALVVRAEGATLPAGAQHFDDVVDRTRPMPDVDVAPEDDATILYTSGTTGRPKGAVSTHRSIVQALFGFACRGAVEKLRSVAPERSAAEPDEPLCFILVVPLFHVTGCVPVMMSTFAGGVKLVIMYKWDPERALELIERERVTNLVGVPTMSWDLLESPDFERRDTSSLRSVGGGGAPAPPELVKRVESAFAKGRPSIGYGMTETNAYGPQNTGDDYVSHPRSTGRGTPILEIKVIDADGATLGPGQLGEICFKGPHLIRGYWNRPDATAETIVDGWLRSGDLGRIDDEGFVYVEDRAKDMILRGGENIYCAEVEAVIYEHPAVYEAAVFGVPHDRLGEEVAAAIHLRDGADLDADGLRAFLAEHLAGFKIPTLVTFPTAQLPRNASGKILKRDLRDELVAERP
ncbi:class I adenylate-forming enzyme family protein [Actinospongicola halichondriae]|uniref:class I adenylate-forming enzyme family protein n=1 Tax=Actinospongicola halichondriae TaxID=3236844 RepID=UPI003D51F959